MIISCGSRASAMAIITRWRIPPDSSWGKALMRLRSTPTSSSSSSQRRRRSSRSEEHTSELQSRGHLVCRLLLEKKKKNKHKHRHMNHIQEQNKEDSNTTEHI